MRPGGADRPDNRRTLAAGQVVHHRRAALPQRRNQLPRHPDQEDLPVDRAVEHLGGVDPVVAQRGYESGHVPVAERGRSGQALPLRPPAPEQRHVRLHAGFVQEDKAFRADPPLMALPVPAAALHAGAAALAGDAGHLLAAGPAASREPLAAFLPIARPRVSFTRRVRSLTVIQGKFRTWSRIQLS